MTDQPTTDVAVREESALTLLPAQRPPAEAARHMLLAHAEMMETAHRLAAGMVRTEMVPKRFQGEDKAHDATAAILYGAELGLNPIQALQRVIPIHGMPSLEARTMVALLKSRGYKVWTESQSAESVTVRGRDLEGDVYESTWTMDRAVLAGYAPTPVEGSAKRPHVKTDWEGEHKQGSRGSYYVVAGNMKYITDPVAMLKAKAQAEVCRDMAPDVLLGISYTSEELESERWDDAPQQRPAPAATSAAPVTADEIMADEVPVPKKPVPDELRQMVDNPPEGFPRSMAEAVEMDRQEARRAAQGSAPAASEPDPKPEPPQVNEPEQTVIPDAEPAPAPAKKPTKKAARTAKEKRLFALLKEVDVTEREDRIIVYRAVADRPEVYSTDDLTDAEVDAIADTLFAWQKAGEADDQIRDILNSAALAEVEAQQPAAQPTAEGN